MNKYISSVFAVLIVMLNSYRSNAQTNLICNPSFEDVDEDALTNLNDADNWYASHVYAWGVDYGSSLFNCWMRDIDHAQASPGTSTGGVNYGIVPGLFPTSDGSTYNFYGYGPNNPFNVIDSDGNVRIFVDPDDGSGLSLSTNQGGLHGLDLSPPNTKFGENVYAPDGTNYAALFDFENKKWDCVPSFFTELKYPLQKDVEYTYSMNFCKMNLLGYLKDLEGWDQVKDGKIEVYISYDEAPFSPRQKVCEIEADDNAWDVTTWNFVAERSYTHLLIEFDPIKGGPVVIHSKIAGVFIDNIKLFEACETADNQCENANYKRDMLDVDMEEVEVLEADAYPDPEHPGIPHLQTVRVTHLDNVKRFEFKIRHPGYTPGFFNVDMNYPPSEFVWDGRDDNGNLMPDGTYEAVINAVSNDCFHITEPGGGADGVKTFQLKTHFSVFNSYVGLLSDDLNLSVGSLENVHEIHVKIYTLSGQEELYDFIIPNPRPVIAVSIESLEALPGNQTITEGNYMLKATLKNNCENDTEITGNGHIGHMAPDMGGAYSQYYDYVSVPKPDFDCPFNFHYNQNVLSPMNCCEGYLHLENMEVWNSWGEINIQDSILIGPNVVFEPGTSNYLNSGGQIIVTPAGTGVIINNATVLTPQTFNCQICKNYTIESNDDYDGDAQDFAQIASLERDSLVQTAAGEMIVFPNPASGEQELTLRAGREPIDPNKYHLTLSNSVGSTIAIKVVSVSEKIIRFKPSTSLMAGAYYLSYESNGVQKIFGIIIK